MDMATLEDTIKQLRIDRGWNVTELHRQANRLIPDNLPVPKNKRVKMKQQDADRLVKRPPVAVYRAVAIAEALGVSAYDLYCVPGKLPRRHLLTPAGRAKLSRAAADLQQLLQEEQPVPESSPPGRGSEQGPGRRS